MSPVRFHSLKRILLCVVLAFIVAAPCFSPAVSAATPEPSELTISQTADNIDKASETIDSFVFELKLFDKNLTTVSGFAWWHMMTYDPSLHPDKIEIILYQNGIAYDYCEVDTFIAVENRYEFVVPEKDPSGTSYIYHIDAPPLEGYSKRTNQFNVYYGVPARSAPMPDLMPPSSLDYFNTDDTIKPAAIPTAVAVPVELSAEEIARLQSISSYNFTVVSKGVYTFTLAPGEKLDITLDDRCEFIVTQTGAISGSTNVLLDTSRVSVEVNGADDETETYPVASGALLANTTATAQFGYSLQSSPETPNVPPPTTPDSSTDVPQTEDPSVDVPQTGNSSVNVPQTGDSSNILLWVLAAAICSIIVMISIKRREQNT